MHVPHSVLFGLFWLKALFAMALCVACLAYMSWRVFDLHSRATPPTAAAGALAPQTFAAGDCRFNATLGFARLEPQTRNVSFGFSLDWAYDTPTRVVEKLGGYKPLVFNTFMDINVNLAGFFDASSLNWYGSEAGRVGAMLELTMQPTSPVRSYTDVHLDTLSKALLAINTQYGVPVLLRFGHEMNGPWSTYAFDPIGYTTLFRNMALSVRKYTNMTAMVWAPNIGFGYPFGTSGGVAIPANGTQAFKLMDTNSDGVIDEWDDPYTPYYPGDDVVDWVALSLYFYPEDQFFNHAPTPGFFEAYLTGVGYNQLADPRWVENYGFYKKFVQAKKKPMMLPETGAPFLYKDINGTSGPSASVAGDPLAISDSAIKELWYKSLFNTTMLEKFPGVKLMVNFEEKKLLGGFWRDWRLTNSTDTLVPFLRDLTAFSGNMKQATAFEYGCDGSVKLA
ncbi:glycoside hydrolase superfamily [Obelidium mucronatum]|nr:glycoside hydrolase superfamily [Obelidium mucronatum]